MTLISVVVGGLITYGAISKAEKDKERRQLRREKLEDVFVPYCTCIEQVISEINKIYVSPKNVRIDKFDSWLAHLFKPYEYLKAEKRVYMSAQIREELENYKKMVEVFKETLDQDYMLFCEKYCEYRKGCADFSRNII